MAKRNTHKATNKHAIQFNYANYAGKNVPRSYQLSCFIHTKVARWSPQPDVPNDEASEAGKLHVKCVVEVAQSTPRYCDIREVGKWRGTSAALVDVSDDVFCVPFAGTACVSYHLKPVRWLQIDNAVVN